MSPGTPSTGRLSPPSVHLFLRVDSKRYIRPHPYLEELILVPRSPFTRHQYPCPRPTGTKCPTDFSVPDFWYKIKRETMSSTHQSVLVLFSPEGAEWSLRSSGSSLPGRQQCDGEDLLVTDVGHGTSPSKGHLFLWILTISRRRIF